MLCRVAVLFNFSEEIFVFPLSFKVLLCQFEWTGRVITINAIISGSFSCTLFAARNQETTTCCLVDLYFVSVTLKVLARDSHCTKENTIPLPLIVRIEIFKRNAWLSQQSLHFILVSYKPWAVKSNGITRAQTVNMPYILGNVADDPGPSLRFTLTPSRHRPIRIQHIKMHGRVEPSHGYDSTEPFN